MLADVASVNPASPWRSLLLAHLTDEEAEVPGVLCCRSRSSRVSEPGWSTHAHWLTAALNAVRVYLASVTPTHP